MRLDQSARKRSTFSAYVELTKPRILTMVLVTAALGFFMGGAGFHGFAAWDGLLTLLIGVAMTSAGSGALNHYLERESDARMERTRNRPLPAGQVHPMHALLLGEYLILGGVMLLLWRVNLLTAFLALLTAFLYVLVYTPMKKWTWLNTLIGAVPGALPPMGGWTAATGELEAGAWVLFAILFFWQQPHFYSIAWIFRDDYARGGFKMLPTEDPDGRRTFRQMLGFSALLIPVSLLPAWSGPHELGVVYFVGASILGALMFASCIPLVRTGSTTDARRVLRMSILYLPLLLALIAFDISL
ncbi:MAG: protoheme IX farnesyltransferase [Candidatus Hydrogenedentes bacterium]|nr:protoheme IX farnesyltransferase [Candidatus Hydrogenedentota bacterium]